MGAGIGFTCVYGRLGFPLLGLSNITHRGSAEHLLFVYVCDLVLHQFTQLNIFVILRHPLTQLNIFLCDPSQAH